MNWRDIDDPMAGGAEIHLHEILRRAVQAGHEVDWVAAGYPGAAREEVRHGIRYHRRGHWLVANWVLPWVVRRLLRSRRFDLLIDDINKIPFFTPLYRASLPLVAVVPHLFGTTVFQETNVLFAAYVWAAEKFIPRVYRQVDFAVISPSTRDDLVARGLPAERIRTILCGLDHARLRLPKPPPRAEYPLLVAWSRLRRYKRLDVAIQAFARLTGRFPEARLAIVGRGPDEARLRSLTGRLGLTDRVDFLGFLPWEELVQLLHHSHVAVNPSPKEGWGLTVIEANGCGLPVIASDAPGLKDSVRDGETGFLVPVGDIAAFAAAAERLLTDQKLWHSQHTAALRWAARFTWDECARESIAYFEEVAQRSLPPGGRA